MVVVVGGVEQQRHPGEAGADGKVSEVGSRCVSAAVDGAAAAAAVSLFLFPMS